MRKEGTWDRSRGGATAVETAILLSVVAFVVVASLRLTNKNIVDSFMHAGKGMESITANAGGVAAIGEPDTPAPTPTPGWGWFGTPP